MIRPAAVGAGHLLGMKSLPPVYLILGATWRCNARCITCFNYRKLNTATQELSLDEHRLVAGNAGPLLWLLFTGGEPVMRDDLPEVARSYYQNCGLRRITIPTNGLLPERTLDCVRKTLKLCPKARIAVSLAVDGVGEVHDRIRAVEGAFDRLLDTYDVLAKEKREQPRLSLNLNTVLMNRNMDNMSKLMEFVLSRMPDADFHGFELFRGEAPDKALAPPSVDEYEDLLGKLETYWSNFPFYRGPFRRWLRGAKIRARKLELEVMKGKRFSCRAGRVVGYIDPEGVVYPCEELEEPMGDLRKESYNLRAIWRGEKAQSIRKSISRKGCTCTHSCFVGASVLFDVWHYPSILQEVVLGGGK